MSLLATKALTKSFGDNYAVNRVDFTVMQGEVLALIGSNGAGKTTLVNLVSGLLRADSGQIIFENNDVTQQRAYDRIKVGIARSFQLVNLFDHLSCVDNVALSIFSRVAVAYALRPKLLFLDEPTSGVSTREKAPIMDIVSSIVRSGGITVVIIEHDMDIVFRYSERIVVMHQGTVLADGTPDQIRANDAVTTTLIGTHPTGEPAFGSSGNA